MKKNVTVYNNNKPKIKSATKASNPGFLFSKRNYTIMFIGLGIIALGFILMSGGGSDDPNVFNPEIYSWRRIRLAPALVLIGFGVQIYAIFANPKK